MRETWHYDLCLLRLLPNRNLASNVDLGEDAAHTTGVGDPTVTDQGLGELIHPQLVLRDRADDYTFPNDLAGKLAPRTKQSTHYLLAAQR